MASMRPGGPAKASIALKLAPAGRDGRRPPALLGVLRPLQGAKGAKRSGGGTTELLVGPPVGYNEDGVNHRIV